MQRSRYITPLGGRLPALERNILKFRAMQITLVIFYAEQLKREIIGCVRATDSIRTAFDVELKDERIPPGTRKALKKALNILVNDNILTVKEQEEIVNLIDYRNVIAHKLHYLMGDLSANDEMYDWSKYVKDSEKYDYNADRRLLYYRTLLSERSTKNHYSVWLDLDPMLFDTAEKIFQSEIGQLRRKINGLMHQRKQDVAALNEELSLEGTELIEDLDPRDPLCRYDNGRLTKRGVEICYRLFDLGKSPMAVAHLIRISLAAARNRRKMWQAVGGENRPKVDISSLPRRKFYAWYDD